MDAMMDARTTKHRAAWLASCMVSAALALTLVVSQASPSHADWREEMKIFRIGMIAEEGAGQTVPGLSSLKRAFAQALGLPVEIFVARDYAALIDAQANGRIDYAIYSTMAYATAALLCSCVEPVAAPVSDDGSTGIMAVLVTRDDRLPSLAEISTHKVAVAPADSVAAAMLSGLSPDGATLKESEPFLIHAGSASAAEAMLIDGSVDAIFGWAPSGASADISGGTLDRLVAAGLDRASLKVIWKSPPLRYGPHALRSGLDSDVRRTLVAFLSGLKDLHPDIYGLLETDHGGDFVEVHADDYAPAVEIVRRLADETPDQ